MESTTFFIPVIRVGTLKTFLSEVPPGAVVRISRNVVEYAGSPIHRVELNAQALNADGHIVWLNEHHEMMWWPGEGPADQQGQQVWAGLLTLQDLLIKFLTGEGFEVREDTSFGIPSLVKPLNGHI